jgi:hypothetical protein
MFPLLGRSSERGDSEGTIIRLIMETLRKGRINLGDNVQEEGMGLMARAYGQRGSVVGCEF